MAPNPSFKSRDQEVDQHLISEFRLIRWRRRCTQMAADGMIWRIIRRKKKEAIVAYAALLKRANRLLIVLCSAVPSTRSFELVDCLKPSPLAFQVECGAMGRKSRQFVFRKLADLALPLVCGGVSEGYQLFRRKGGGAPG